MAQHIVVTEYNPLWADMFETEAMKIKKILSKNCIAIHHIGSTSVVGLAAKPIIDILPVVYNLKDVDEAAAEFEKIGYEYMGEFGISGRRYLRKGGDERTHHVHIFAENSLYDIERHLAVRDYLRTHPAACERYGRLKKELANRYPYDIEGYCDGKEEFVQRLEKEALEWKNRQLQSSYPVK